MREKDWKKIGKLGVFIGEITIFGFYSMSS
jgi:hypothetical protein